MKNTFRFFAVTILLSGFIVGCSSENDDSGDSDGGGYIGCVFELTEARRAGLISATDQEIQQECSQTLLP